MPSSHLILCFPLLLLPPIPPSIRVFSNESALHMRWPKYQSFSISPSNEHPGLISFRVDWLDLLAVQGNLKSLLQHHSSKASVLRHSAFLLAQSKKNLLIVKALKQKCEQWHAEQNVEETVKPKQIEIEIFITLKKAESQLGQFQNILIISLIKSSCEFLREQSLAGSDSIQQYSFTVFVHTYLQVDEQENGHNSYFLTWILSLTHSLATKTSMLAHTHGLSVRWEVFYFNS